MSGRTVSSAILVLVLGNLFATICDVFVKLAGPDIAIFRFTFVRVAFMCLMLAPLVIRRNMVSPFAGIKVHFLRGNIWIVLSFLLVISLTQLPLATANAVFYTAPIFIILLSSIFFREKLTKMVFIAATSGFTGVLVILKPSYMGWPMLSALAFAFLLACNSLLVRKLPKEQNALHGLLLSQFCALPLAGVLALWEGGSLTWEQIGYGLLASCCSVLYSLACVVGYRFVASSQVSSAEYSGLLFAIVAGWLLFGEQPDISLLFGALLIVLPLLYISHADVKKAHRKTKLAEMEMGVH